MRMRSLLVMLWAGVALGCLCPSAFADFGIDFSPLHAPGFGQRLLYSFQQQGDGLLHPTAIPAQTPAPPTAAPPHETDARQTARHWFSQGVAAMNVKDWAGAERFFAQALQFIDDADIRRGLLDARTFKAYEQYLKEEQARKGRELLQMSDCLTALSEALAAVKSSVADSGITRHVQAGADDAVAGDSVLTDADVVDLRHVTLGIVDLEQLKSSYARPPAPITVHEPTPLTDKQTTKLANIFVAYELGFSPSEQDIEELLGQPVIDHSRPATQDSRAAASERKQVHAALDRFSVSLVAGCNKALSATSQQLNADPLVKNIKTLTAAVGWDNLDPALKAQWAERNLEAEQQLFAQFTNVQDRAIRQLGFECTAIFDIVSSAGK